MDEPLLTIITPTYNRADFLPRLFRSLVDQSSLQFKWLIIDDGSTDDTKEVVSKFKGDRRLSIEYIYKENGGKHSALNEGISQTGTDLVMIVDSDDTLLPDAIEVIYRYYYKYRNNEKIASWSFLRCYSDGRPIVGLDKDEIIDNYIKYRIRGNRPGDMAEVFKTEVLRKYPFPEYSGERFLSEDVVWIEIGKQFDSVYINKAIYQCEYLDNGLTANDKPMKFASPQGSMLRGKQLMTRECGIRANIKGAIIYDCYRLESKGSAVVHQLSLREKILTVCCYPLGVLYNIKWKGK